MSSIYFGRDTPRRVLSYNSTCRHREIRTFDGIAANVVKSRILNVVVTVFLHPCSDPCDFDVIYRSNNRICQYLYNRRGEWPTYPQSPPIRAPRRV
jgi:hypothetical protein